MKRAAIYARVSTIDRGQDPETRLRQLREYAERRSPLEALPAYLDRPVPNDFPGTLWPVLGPFRFPPRGEPGTLPGRRRPGLPGSYRGDVAAWATSLPGESRASG